MRYNSFQSPGLGPADGGLFENDLVLTQPPYEPDLSGEETLRLAPQRTAPEPKPPRLSKGVPLPLMLCGWAAVLGAALGVAVYVTQPAAPPDPADQPPIPAPAPEASALGTPVTAPPIASQPAQFTAAPPGPDAPQLALAEAPNPPPLEVRPAPPEPPEVSAVQTAADAPKPVARKVETAQVGAKPAARAEPAVEASKPKPAKLQKVAADQAPAKSEKALADAQELPKLKVRLNRAYAEAVKAGTPKSVLKARQAEWAVLRAKAEKKGPAAVAALYKTRAAQLEALARKKTAKARVRAA